MKPANTLEIESLGADWCDKDLVMLHACFQLLKDCVERENLLDGHVDWDQDAEHRQAKAQIAELYTWWMKRTESDHSDLARETYEEDNAKLRELIELRKYLWT